MTIRHTLKSFDDALSAITGQFRHMGDLVVENCAMAAKAYLSSDRELALEVINRDLDIDELFESIRGDCFDILLKFQPVAGDLRLVMGIEHAVGDLERAGDHVKNIARRVISNPARDLSGTQTKKLSKLADKVGDSLRNSVHAMIGRNSEDARRVIAGDSKIDARNRAIFDTAMVDLQGEAPDAHRLVQQLLVSKAFERIGDHATNIAEEALFITRGVAPGATRTRQEFK